MSYITAKLYLNDITYYVESEMIRSRPLPNIILVNVGMKLLLISYIAQIAYILGLLCILSYRYGQVQKLRKCIHITHCKYMNIPFLYCDVTETQMLLNITESENYHNVERSFNHKLIEANLKKGSLTFLK